MTRNTSKIPRTWLITKTLYTVYIYIYIYIYIWMHANFSAVSEAAQEYSYYLYNKEKRKVFYRLEPPSGESTTKECGDNYQLLAVIYWSSPIWNSYLQSTTKSYGQWRQRRKTRITGCSSHHHGWSHSSPPDRLVHSINRCSSATPGIHSCNLATFGKRGNHLAYAATQGICGHAGYMRPRRVYAATQGISGHAGYLIISHIWFLLNFM